MDANGQGRIQVYTGNGKGKTTAAFGLVLRACGHHRKVCIIQFLKGGAYTGEVIALRDRLPDVDIFQFGHDGFAMTDVEEQKAYVASALAHAEHALTGGAYDLVVLDEINVCVSKGVLKTADVLALLDRKAPRTEVILTGRNAAPELIERADLVTEMRKEKHYYDRGIEAREGVEY